MEVSFIQNRTRHFKVLIIPQISNRGDNRSALNSPWKRLHRTRVILPTSPPPKTRMPASVTGPSQAMTDLPSSQNLTMNEASCTTIKDPEASNIIKEKVIKPLTEDQVAVVTTMTRRKDTSMPTRSILRARKTVVVITKKETHGQAPQRTTT